MYLSFYLSIYDAVLSYPYIDHLYPSKQIINYWNKLAFNTKNAIGQSVSEKDPIKTLTLIGITLHVVQDFYTHSNFTELFRVRGSSVAFPQTWWNNDLNITAENTFLNTGYTNRYRSIYSNR